MTEHLSPSVLSALADGELSNDQLAGAQRHLADCPTCTADALHQSLLKLATAKAGMRYTPPSTLHSRLTAFKKPAPKRGYWSPGWVVAAALLLVFTGLTLVQQTTRRNEVASIGKNAQVTEVFDQHLATLAGNATPQVLSSDRHTVKPWFQGKLPFSFTLPENLPNDTTLDGANLTYLHDRPVAQLLYSIGKHRVSVFVRERQGAVKGNELTTARSGYQVMEFTKNDLEVFAISDVDGARLAALVDLIRKAQTR
jgi:anti-sigma factor RsiW